MTHSRVGLACVVALLCVIGCSLPAAASAADIIVRRDAGLSAGERAAVRADAGVELDRMLAFPETEVVTVPDGRQADALARLNADADVRYAVPNETFKVAAPPVGDALQGLQWGLHNDGNVFAGSVADADIDAPDAWDVMEGQGVTVGVVDQSVDASLTDLAGNVEPAEDFLHGAGCGAGDPTGFADHGTHIAGTLAALRDNGGIAGVAPLAHVKPLRTADNCGTFTLAGVIEAFTYAGRQHIPIVTAAFGTEKFTVDPGLNQTFTDIFDTYPDTLYVVAAGNEGADVDRNPVYPCSTKRPGTDQDIANLVCVGMTDIKDDPACWGNVGQTSVDLFAPGVMIYSTVRGPNPVLPLTGTSMAVSMVAGAAAVLLSIDPRLTPLQVAEQLRATTDRKSALEPFSVAGGRLNVARAAEAPGRLGSGGGESKAWVTCDRDHDGVRDDRGQDKCPDTPDTPGSTNGCPDSDGDGLTDNADNCAKVANADQADADGDGLGDRCDETPRGDDADGDFKPFLDDRCPYVAGASADGCPIVNTPPGPEITPVPTPSPTVTPQATPDPVIVSLRAKVSKCPKGKTCTKVAKVTVKLSRQAKVALKVERQTTKKGRLVWTRVSSRSLTANTRGSTVTVRGKRGKTSSKYRVTATLAGKAKAVTFRV